MSSCDFSPILQLPTEILTKILLLSASSFNKNDVLELSCVCRRFRAIIFTRWFFTKQDYFSMTNSLYIWLRFQPPSTTSHLQRLNFLENSILQNSENTEYRQQNQIRGYHSRVRIDPHGFFQHSPSLQLESSGKPLNIFNTYGYNHTSSFSLSFWIKLSSVTLKHRPDPTARPSVRLFFLNTEKIAQWTVYLIVDFQQKILFACGIKFQQMLQSVYLLEM